jgi:hypothetical protein
MVAVPFRLSLFSTLPVFLLRSLESKLAGLGTDEGSSRRQWWFSPIELV